MKLLTFNINEPLITKKDKKYFEKNTNKTKEKISHQIKNRKRGKRKKTKSFNVLAKTKTIHP